MNIMSDHLARVQMDARLGEAKQRRREHQLARAHRMTRRAELAAQQARTALARVI